MNQLYKYVNIEFKNIKNNSVVDFNFVPMLHNKITHRWLELLEMATQLYVIDQPERFYDFGTHEQEVEKALSKIEQDISIINNHEAIIERELTDVHDQDTLNYLHHIFEVYHGLLNKQATEYWDRAPTTVRNALADLNIDVHRCETVQDNNNEPRFVTTWYGMPKTHHIFDEDYDLFTNKYTFGTMYLTYAEIGKTLEHLCKDRELDEYSHAAPEAFQPYDLFSSDFHVRLHNRDDAVAAQEFNEVWKYYDTHAEFFTSYGFTRGDKRLAPGALPIAQLETSLSDEDVVAVLADHQYVSKITIIKD